MRDNDGPDHENEDVPAEIFLVQCNHVPVWKK